MVPRAERHLVHRRARRRRPTSCSALTCSARRPTHEHALAADSRRMDRPRAARSTFEFEGRAMRGFAGDTITSALWAAACACSAAASSTIARAACSRSPITTSTRWSRMALAQPARRRDAACSRAWPGRGQHLRQRGRKAIARASSTGSRAFCRSASTTRRSTGRSGCSRTGSG